MKLFAFINEDVYECHAYDCHNAISTTQVGMESAFLFMIHVHSQQLLEELTTTGDSSHPSIR